MQFWLILLTPDAAREFALCLQSGACRAAPASHEDTVWELQGQAGRCDERASRSPEMSPLSEDQKWQWHGETLQDVRLSGESWGCSTEASQALGRLIYS